jgi:hypothetical protein
MGTVSASTRVFHHLRGNVIGYVALFVALSGTAYAVDGPLPGQNQVGSADIIDNEVKSSDIGTGQVKNADVAAQTIKSGTIGNGSVQGIDVLDDTLTDQDIAQSAQFNGASAGGELADTFPNPTIGTVSGLDLAPSASPTSGVNFEGATDDANESSLTATDPTADRTITLPDAGGEASLLGQSIQDAEVDNQLTIGGSTINRHKAGTLTNLSSPLIPANDCANYFVLTFSSGVDATDVVIATPIANSSTNGIEENDLMWNSAVSDANEVTIRACNPTGSAVNPADDQEWIIHTWGP